MSIWEWLNPPKVGPTYKVIELEKRLSVKADKEVAESVATLAAHPGFVYLTQRLDAQNAALKAKLVFEKHTDMDAVTFLQAGIYWSNWLKLELQRSTTKAPDRQVDPFEEELRAFREIDATIERVGE